MLTHRSGLTRTSACNNNPYQCLKKAVEIGSNPPFDRKYQNLNYTIFRYILPRIRNSAVDEVFCTSGMSESDVNANVSERFARHIRDQVLAPLSIQTGFEWTASEFALRYDFSNPSSPGLRQDTSDDYLEAGSGGMKWSAQEFGEFLAALESGKIVSESSLRTMKASLIGFDSVVPGLPGEYYTKNGGALNTESQLVIFPGKVSAYVTINSGNNAYGPKSRANILINSYEKAVLQ